MIRILLGLLWLLFVSLPVSADEAPPIEPQVAFPQLRFRRPLYMTYPPDGSDRLFVLEQAGRVLWFKNHKAVADTHVALDIGKQVRRNGNEEGLLGLAFHPDFKSNGQVFLHYTAARGRRRNILARFVMDKTRGKIDPASRQIILEVDQPWANHNGGMITFGPDGYLYIALGDGGAGGDPLNNGQNKATLLGSILRIDVDHRDPGLAYGIPPDNPFVGVPDARGELWAYGLRNVWRFSFDRQTGELWAGDVGQVQWEEIDLIKKGSNYGWNAWEGNHPFKPTGEGGPFEKPVIEHPRAQARSITGGYVYRGKQNPSLQGAYVYGDFATGLVWCLRYDGRQVTEHRYITHVPSPSSFGEVENGEIYITSFDGQVYKFVTNLSLA